MKVVRYNTKYKYTERDRMIMAGIPPTLASKLIKLGVTYEQLINE